GQGRAKKESGEAFLRKPGRMRWAYSSPQGKLFVTDGKYAWLYTPGSNQVEKTPIKQTDDLRAPLAFLLGKLEFQRDFKRFIWRPEGADYWVVAEPKSDQLAYREVEFLVTPEFQIRRLRVTGQDRSVMEFRFDRERLNPPLSEKLFQFDPPPGAVVIERRAED
ncbi:MAG: outer membrane lipoprotein carrier protein LolA, partial [Acidobacteriota bacterium]